ncbi:MAG: hypothetical protein QNJ33_15835 [Crocosphaera sp.]|nr:hypothetical protein [Crocosphaera sp.]
MTLEDRQNKLYCSHNHQELLDYYGKWATEYDQELVNECCYIAPQKVTDVLLRLVSNYTIFLKVGYR